jgi:hypothetical protein
MSAVTRHALRVYSALAELKGNSEDILDALIRFFEPVLEVMNGKVFDPALFAVGVQKLYRWRFTADIAENFIPRLVRKGFLVRHTGSRRQGVYTVRFVPQPVSNDLPISEVLIGSDAGGTTWWTAPLGCGQHPGAHNPLCMSGLNTWNEASHRLCALFVGFRTDSHDKKWCSGFPPSLGRHLYFCVAYMCAGKGRNSPLTNRKCRGASGGLIVQFAHPRSPQLHPTQEPGSNCDRRESRRVQLEKYTGCSIIDSLLKD